MKNEQLKKILKESINLSRWGEKTDLAFPFLEEEERQEIVDLFMTTLDKEGYIIKKEEYGIIQT